MKDFVNEVRLEDWTDFKRYVDDFPEPWIYRGQASAEWELSSSLERSPGLGEHCVDIERELLAEYQRVAHFLLKPAHNPKSTLDWLALLQHHGTPTRLIDFSKSPYVAAFFAFEHPAPAGADTVAIWCIDRRFFYQQSLTYLRDRLDTSAWHQEDYIFPGSAFEQIFDRNDLACVMPFKASRPTERDVAQQSLFVTTAAWHIPIADQFEFLAALHPAPFINKVIMPAGLRVAVLHDLRKMNITPATLFPGIDGFARALNLHNSTLRTFEAMGAGQIALRAAGFSIP